MMGFKINEEDVYKDSLDKEDESNIKLIEENIETTNEILKKEELVLEEIQELNEEIALTYIEEEEVVIEEAKELIEEVDVAFTAKKDLEETNDQKNKTLFGQMYKKEEKEKISLIDKIKNFFRKK